jgi:tetratricopeptide (TPR) repeat protein
MKLRGSHLFVSVFACQLGLAAVVAPAPMAAQSSASGNVAYVREKTPTLVDPAGPTISLIASEPVFDMAAALNTCGYDEGLSNSLPERQRVREQISAVMAKSEDARARRDALCLYIAQHRMTGTERDNSQYLSLSLYLTPPPELEVTADLTEMPPDATQVAEVAPLLKSFAEAVDLRGIWLTTHRLYDEDVDKLHDPLSKMVVNTNLYLKMPASTYDGRRFIVVVEPQLSPGTVNARVYGTDYVVLVSPTADGKIRMNDIRHTYLHYLIEPLLFARSNAIDRTGPILKEIREAPLEFRYRSDTVALTVECLIKAIEARTMDTGIPDYKLPTDVDRSALTKFEIEKRQVEARQEQVRVSTVRHDMTQGFVLTQYFYEQMVQFERDPAGLRDNIGEMVYSMDVDQQVHRARQLEFDKEADTDVLVRSKPKKLEGLDLAEAKLSNGDVKSAASMAEQTLKAANGNETTPDAARAHFLLARVEALTGQPEAAIGDFQKTLANSKDQRLLSWSHIYLGRMLDLDCKRDEAVSEYKLALENRDGRQDTRLAAERGVKLAYAVKGHSCQDEDQDGAPQPADKNADRPAEKPANPSATPQGDAGNPFPGGI